MRFADTFNPEWGYLAPAPSFLRTARIVLVAAAVGATAGGAVVFSLVDRPAAEETSVAARTLVAPADTAVRELQAARGQQAATPGQANAQAAGEDQSAALALASAHAAGSPAPSESRASSTSQGSASIAGLVEAPAAAADVLPPAALGETAAAPVPDAAPVQKKMVKKPPVSWRAAPRNEQASNVSRGPLALLRAFTAPGTSGVYQPRSEY